MEERLRIQLTDMAYLGEALGRHDGQVVFVAYGIPGEEVLVELGKRKPGYLEGAVAEVLSPSSHRVTPPCPYFGACSGCAWQHIDYAYQLELKQRIVAEQLRRIGKLEGVPVAPTLASPSPYHYRNQARFSVDAQGKLGFVRRHTRRFLPIEACLIMDSWINQAMLRLQGRAPGAHQVVVRYGVNTGNYLIHPGLGEGVGLETGQPYYEEVLGGRHFRISGASFFQVNIAQAEQMVGVVRDRLGLTGTQLLVDAYAGVGTFGALLAPQVAKIIAIEESAVALRDAEVNMAGIANLELHQAKTEQVLPQLKERPDAVILDPPRAGCHRQVLAALLELKPRRVVYVSCDPATLARDLAVLVAGGYGLLSVEPIDMFPQTYHIEAVATLEWPSG